MSKDVRPTRLRQSRPNKMLFKLPSDLTLEILRTWLSDGKDIASLDVACCKHTRQAYYSVLCCPTFFLRTDMHAFTAEHALLYMKWLVKRHVRTDQLTIGMVIADKILDLDYKFLPCVTAAVFVDGYRDLTRYGLSIRHAAFPALLAALPNLTSVNCALCSSMNNDNAMLLVAHYADRLQELRFNAGRVYNSVLRRMCLSLMQLRRLQILNDAVGSQQMHEPGNGQSLDPCLPCLESLEYVGNKLTTFPPSMAQHIVSCHPRLRSFSASMCCEMNLPFLALLLQSELSLAHLETDLVRLQDRSLVVSSQVDPDELHAFLRACPALQSIVCRECEVGAEMLRCMADLFGESLRVLNCRLADDIADSAVLHLLSRCHKLSSLTFSNYISASDETLLAISLFCPELVEFRYEDGSQQWMDKFSAFLLQMCRKFGGRVSMGTELIYCFVAVITVLTIFFLGHII
ncbi:hypothetical protein EON64_10295 [archaeon]|nr:MAG: hypothetical protein EON64_10295 [archaeon]